MKINPAPPSKVRTLATHEGLFLNLEDMRLSLNNDAFMEHALALLKVGHDKDPEDPRKVIRYVIGDFIFRCSGNLSSPKVEREVNTCSPEHPMSKGAPGYWKHTNATEVSREKGWLRGDIVRMRCADCGHAWTCLEDGNEA